MTREGTFVYGKKRAAIAAVAIALGVAGCGSGGAAPAAEDTGPFTKGRAQADLDGAMADAGAPSADPDWGRAYAKAPAGSAQTCFVFHRGYATKGESVDLGRFEAVMGELSERGWKEQQPKDGVERKAEEMAQAVLLKRGWSLVAEFRSFPEADSYISLAAFDKACVEENGGISAPPGFPLGAEQS
ncbi:hypothetical protein ACIQMY_21280 [Streptomyces sp. NPDC091368]|uniref:hypothetical protein n=1 Tax=Streptomyces sp. NPDC091368 TaxID=3365993 RepID=UPI0037F3EB8B